MATLTLLVGEEYYRHRFAEHEERIEGSAVYTATSSNIEDVMKDVRWALRMGRNVVLSAPNETRSERSPALRWLPEGTIIKCIVFGRLPNRYEAPSYDEGFKTIVCNL